MKITEHHCITGGYKSVLTPTLAHLCVPTSQLDEEECFLQKTKQKSVLMSSCFFQTSTLIKRMQCEYIHWIRGE